jgi:hypothetical protein
MFAGDWVLKNPMNAPTAGAKSVPADRLRWSSWSVMAGEPLVRWLRDEVFPFYTEVAERSAMNFMTGARLKKGEALPAQRHYFVDEAGDSVLFGKRGKLMLGQEGCSRFFMMGCLEVADPAALAAEMGTLRAEMLADPTINRVPSMTPERKKTALAFHAKDDIPEVLRDVFKLLVRHEVKFYAIIRDKAALAATVKRRNATDPAYRYNENEVYDDLVSRLFKDRLHKADHHEVVFARRGNKDRTHALCAALDKARDRFFKQWGIRGNGTVAVQAASPRDHGGLQAVDYFLWVLQRRNCSRGWRKACAATRNMSQSYV